MTINEARAKTTIIIPVHNALDHVRRLLVELEETESSVCNKIYVDDFSAPATSDVIKKFMHQNEGLRTISYLRNDRQQLFTRTVNRGLRAAQPDTEFYMILNTDVELRPGWLDALLTKMLEREDIGIVGYGDGRLTELPEDPDEEVFEPNYVTGHAYMIRRSVLDSVGLLCETDMPRQAHIASENIHCRKAMAAGFRAFYIHKPFIIHDSGGASWHRDIGWLCQFPYDQCWRGRDTW